MGRRSDFVATAATAIVVAVIGYFAYTMRDVILLACGAAICAVASQPLIERLRRVEFIDWRPGVLTALTIVSLAVAEIGLIIAALTPSFLTATHRMVASWQVDYGATLAGLIADIPAAPPETVRYYVGRATAAALIWIVLAIILRQYGRRIARSTIAILPRRVRPKFVSAVDQAISHHDQWLVRDVTQMLFAGLASFMTLGLLGVKDFYALAVLTAVASLFPPAGMLLAAIVCALVSGADSMFQLVGVMAFFAAYSELENGYLRVRLADGRASLPLLAMIVALMLGMTIAGLSGTIIALPTAVVASILVGSFVMRAPLAGLPLDPCSACELEQLGGAPEMMRRLPVVVVEHFDRAAVADAGAGWPVVQKIALMLANGTAALLVLAMLNVQHSYALAAVVAMSDVVPVVGPLSAVLLCAIVAGAESTFKVAALLGFFAVYPQIESAYLEPRISDRRVVITIAIICVAVIIGLAAWGVAGALLAIPIAISAALVVIRGLFLPDDSARLDSRKIFLVNQIHR
jgi:predicted PurR-regulated permease PerM